MEEVTVIGVSSASSHRPKAPAFVFLTPVESTWEHLNSIIPNVLQLSVIDYPFVNPGPVGGKGEPEDPVDKYGFLTTTRPPPKPEDEAELYIRWWQLNTFLPIVHILKPPTAFPEHIVTGVMKKVIHSLTKLRQNIVVPHLLKFADSAFMDSTPVIRPLWMLDPHDEVAQAVDDQFLVGDDLLVAPILNLGQRRRDVYLPGENVVWKRSEDGAFFTGGNWLRDEEVDLTEILYFLRANSDDLPGKSSTAKPPVN